MMGHGGGAWTLMRRRELDKDHKLAKGTIPRALRMAGKYRFAVVAFVVITVLSAMLAGAPPKLLETLIDKGIVKQNRDVVNNVALVGVGVAVALALAGLISRFISSRLGEGLIYDMRVGLFDHVLQMPLAFFTRTQTGSLISRLNNDVVGAQSAMTQTLGSIVDNVIRLATFTALMFAIEWRITLMAIALLPAFLIPGKRIGRKLQDLQRDRMELNAKMNARMTERFNVAGAMVSKLFGNPRAETDAFSERAAEVRDSGVTIAVYARVLFVMLAFVTAVGSAAVYWIGGRWAIPAVPGGEAQLSIGEITALIAYVGMIYGPLTMLTNARVDLMTSFVSFERVFEVLDLAPSIADAPDAIELTEPRGRIEFRDVRFTYPRANEVSLASLESVAALDQRDSGEVLKGVSFVAEPGMTVALVGPSGAGKTTISNLIPRLYDVSQGAVLVDGHDVRGLTQLSLRAAIGVVAQDPHLFHDSVATNLRFAKPDATDEQIVEACTAAQIHHVIERLPDGYDTVVGERGYRFSGGEKQRLAIARVLLKAPPIIILDEATSHLDSESEALIQRALDAALTGRTSIVIAHRLSTIVAADQILVVDDGRITQRGTHAELIAEGGTYGALYATQFART